MVNKVELTDDFILLRPYKLSDVELLYEAVRESIPEVSAWQDWCHPGYSIEESRDFVAARSEKWKRGMSYDFAMVDPRDGRYLGGCGINEVDSIHKTANLGYWVRTSRTNQGIATAATRLLAKFGFKQLGLLRIEIVVAVGNKASRRVANRAGAKPEGVQRNRLFLHGKPIDAMMFSLIPSDMK